MTNHGLKIDVDEGLYSRQLYVLGRDAMRLVSDAHVLISGLGGLGVEVAKNIILSGVRSVTLHDDKVCSWDDLANQFFLSEQDLGQNRALSSSSKLRELNHYVHIRTLTGLLTDEELKNYSVVVLTDTTFDEQLRISEITHSLDIRLIIGEVRGLCYKIFCDFGETFTVVDLDGEPRSIHLVAGITREKEGVVALVDDAKHGLQDGDFVTFSEIQGMTELNDCPPIKVKVLLPDAFIIGDTSNFSPYTGGGIMNQVKIPTILKFESLEKALNSLDLQEITGMPEGRSLQLHLAFLALNLYKEERKRYPRPWNSKDSSDFFEKCKTVASQLGLEINIDFKLLINFSNTCSGYFCPIAAIAGGTIAQEVLKACSAKFAPIRQWQYFDAFDCLPEEYTKEDFTNMSDSRYAGQIAIFGSGIQNQLQSLKYFIIGMGAIGCELLKNLAMMGVGTGSEGEIVITDADLIEKCNLNRQFLYRLSDVRKQKTIVAATAIKKINPQLNITAEINKVDAETEKIYDSDFYRKLDGIMSAVDNFESRVYIDRQCVYHRKPLIDSGTLGLKGSTQVIVPFLTESYCSARDPPEKNIPICTLKSFPNTIEHTIIWARDVFNNFFYDSVKTAASFLKDSLKFKERIKNSSELEIEVVASIKHILVDERPTSFVDCVAWARLQWQELFHNQIRQLLLCFPSDQISSNGQLFWSGPKRCPIPLEFSISDPVHLDFIVAGANLKAKVYDIPQNRDRNSITEMVNKISVPGFTFRTLKVTEDEHEYVQEFRATIPNKNILMEVAETLPTSNEITLDPLIFEKDEDYNFHIDFITSAANLRARNYKIPPTDRLNVKLIAGKITPAIATTTSVVAGLACLEVVKLAQLLQDITRYKNNFLNLALPFLAISEPFPAPKMKFYEYEWNLWFRFDIEGELTLNEFLAYFKTKWKLVVTMVTFGVCVLYSSFSDQSLKEQRSDLKMSQLCSIVSKKEVEPHQKSLVFEICCSTLEGKDVDVPYVNYILPNKNGSPTSSKNHLEIKFA